MKKKSGLSQQPKPDKKSQKTATKQQQPQQPQEPNPEPQQKFSLYALLQLPQGPKSTPQQIKQQYRKLVITYHPDKNQGSEDAKQKFQKLKEAYDILSDPEKKIAYDQTGLIGGDFDQRAFETAYQYFRGLYRKIQKKDLEEFQERYRFGEMEEEDLMDYYDRHGGDMTQLLESIPLSRNEDIPRFLEFYTKKISQKHLKPTKSFQKTRQKIRLLKDETQQFLNQTKSEQQPLSNLILAIRNKPKTSFLESLEQKYAPKKQKVQVKEDKDRKDRKRRGKNGE